MKVALHFGQVRLGKDGLGVAMKRSIDVCSTNSKARRKDCAPAPQRLRRVDFKVWEKAEGPKWFSDTPEGRRYYLRRT